MAFVWDSRVCLLLVSFSGIQATGLPVTDFVLYHASLVQLVLNVSIVLGAESGIHQPPPDQRRSTSGQTDSPSGTPGSIIAPNPPVSGSTPTPTHFTPPPPPPPTNADTLMDLLRRYPVMWQGLFALKNDSAAVQMHFLSGK